MLEDYVCYNANKSKYPIENYLSYENISEKHNAFLTEINMAKEPKSYTQAIKDKNWCKAMESELKALKENKTWEIIELPQGKKARATSRYTK